VRFRRAHRGEFSIVSLLSILLLAQADGVAGSTQSVFNLAQALRAAGHAVTVGRSAGGRLDALAAADGFVRPPLTFAGARPLARDLRAWLARHPVDVVSSQSTMDRRACAWLRWQGALTPALVVTRRTMPLTWFPELQFVGQVADRTIAVSSTVARALARRGHPAGRVVVVPNGVRLERLDAEPPPSAVAAAAEVRERAAGRPVVLMVARRKDQEVLLRAAHFVSTPLALVFAGVTPDRPLRALAAGLPQRHGVQWLGVVEHPLPLYGVATLGVLPSRIEGLSQALLEAMALGVPVLASRAGGNVDLIQDGVTGRLLPPLDHQAWGRALEEALGAPDTAQRWAAAARARVLNEFTVAHTAARTEAVCREAMARRTAATPVVGREAGHDDIR
jgi:glycosyltransferase involved in cell wall biosynthesis